jgi:peroxiredoxin Q/BCP
MPEPGQPAPGFSIPDHRGNQVSLEDYRGKRVVLWFYPKADTPG